MADLVDKIYDVEEKADRASKTNATKLVKAKEDGFDVAGEGFLQKRGGKWILSEPDFLTEEEANKIYAKIRHSHNEYALRRHAPTHHYGGADPLEGQEIHGLRVVDRPTWAAVTLTEFGKLQTLVGDSSYAAIYGTGVTPSGSNYSLRFDDSGLSAVLNASTALALAIGGTSKVGVTASEMNLASGVALKMAATTVIDASRNITGTTIKGLNAAGTGIRPAVALADGTFDDQDAATFRGTISAAAAVHDHTSITGSAAKLTTPRSIGMSGDGTWSVSFDGSTNVSGAMTLASIITAGGPVGSPTKTPQFTWDSKGRLTAVDEVTITPAWSSITSKPTTFSGLGVTMLASDIPNHASRHHWDGADPLVGQSIAGLRTTSSPSFYDVTLGGNLYFGSVVGVGRNGYGGVYLRPSSGIVRLTVEDAETYCSNAFSANSGRFANLSTGFVRSNSIGQLSSGALSASELPNHASRHHWDGADPLTGQSINGLRTVDSPRFLNLNLDGALNFIGYSINTYDGDAFYVENSSGWQLIKSTLANGTIITTGLFPSGNGLELGKDGYRWRLRADDTNNEVEIINATEGSAGTNIAAIPAIGNYFRLSAPTSGGYKNYRVPDKVSGIGKDLVITATSTDPNGFIRVYPPNNGDLFVNGNAVSYIDFVWGKKLVLHSDGVRWYV